MISPVFENPYTDRELSVFTTNRTKPRLRWYEFKEGFSSILVEEALEAVNRPGKPLRVLDPFSGSGTTLVTAAKHGHLVTGVEVNPFLAFTASAKCYKQTWSRHSFERTIKRLCAAPPYERRSNLENFSTFTERAGATKWLFNRSVLRGFAAIDSKLSRRFHAYEPIRLALLAAAMECSNVRRDGKCLRYNRGWHTTGHSSGELRDIFVQRLHMIFDDLQAEPLEAGTSKVIQADARQALRDLKSGSIDLIVTSPPYLNSFDYSDVYRPELFLGGFVKDNNELRAIRLRTVRSHVQANWESPHEMVSDMLSPVVARIKNAEGLWNRRLPMMVQAYFEDMRTILAEAHRIVSPGGQAWIVVSTSAYGGIEIPVDLIIADVATRQGWRLCGVNALRSMRAAGQHWAHLTPGAKPPLRESLIILERP